MHQVYMADCESLLLPDKDIPGLRAHEPFIIEVSKMSYIGMSDNDPLQPAYANKRHTFNFQGPDCMFQMLAWAKQIKEPTTVLFHNGSGYDSIIFLRQIRQFIGADDDMPKRMITSGNLCIYFPYTYVW